MFDPNWGGAIVWLSTDNTSYIRIGEIDGPSRMGVLTADLPTYSGANPDAGHTLSVDLSMSGGELESEASPTDAANGANLCYVDGEFISFEVPTLTGAYTYDLTNLYRGMSGSAIGAHLSGSNFAFIDESIFKYTLPPEYIGVPLWLKFQSVNIFNGATQALSDCVAYPYTPTGAAYGSGPGGVPVMPAGFSGSDGPGYSRVTWNTGSSVDGVTEYGIYRATGTAQPFSAASKIGNVGAATLEYNDVTGTPDQPYTYFVVATNGAGSSTNTTGITLTPSESGGSVEPWKVNATGTGVSQAITLPYPDVDENGVFVFVNGLRAASIEYSIAGTTLTITTNATGDAVEIIGIVQ